MTMNACRERGFTLIELLVTITVLVVVLMMAIPNFSPFLQGQRIKNAGMDMASSAALARSEAIKRNAQIYVISGGQDWSGGWTVSSVAPATSAGTIRGQAPLTGLSIAEKAQQTQFSFGGDGRLQSSAVAFTIKPSSTGGQPPVCVAVGLTGRVQTTNGSC